MTQISNNFKYTIVPNTATTTADIEPSTDRNYVTDAELVVIGNTSGTNTGDVTLAGTPDYITIANQVITRGLVDLTTDITGILPQANGGCDVAYIGTSANTDVASVTDQTIVSRDVTGMAVGDKLEINAAWTITNDSGATRAYTFTLDFDGLFDIEITTGALANSATVMHPFMLKAAFDLRASNLCYCVVAIEGFAAAGMLSGQDTTMSAACLRAIGWGASASDATGTTTVVLKCRSADATATQTFRLHNFSIRKNNDT